jgi:primary-amine oxidase
MAITPQDPPRVGHPLDPLSADEVARVAAILRARPGLGPRVRFIAIGLREPTRQDLAAAATGQPVERTALAVVLDNDTGMTSEAVVSLDRDAILAWEEIPGVQPSITVDEFIECEALCKADPDWQAAVRRRGVADFDLCMVDPWSNGHYGNEEDGRLRLVRALTWVRTSPLDNGYARPIENLITVVDLNAMRVVRVEDGAVVPLPPNDANYTEETVGAIRTDLKPIEITQPEGPSFQVDGHEISWQKWRFRIGFNAREGLTLHTVSYQDGDRERPILHRASICDMVVPYGDPRPHYNRRNAFDHGEYGVGLYANSLTLGCDCLGEITYFDAVINDTRGNPITIQNAICLHEEDYSILWKHTDLRTGAVEVRRSRRLVVSMIATVGNYEYGFYWYFYQDGTFELEIKMSGVLSNGAVIPGKAPKWGTIVAPGVYAPIHQHFFCARLDVTLDGPTNAVYELNTVAEPPGPDHPLDNAFYETATLLSRESEAQRTIDPLSARTWKIVNRESPNGLGQVAGYRLMPGDNVLPFAAPTASILARAAFMTKHLWVTRYDPRERFATGDYPNQHPGGAGLPAYVAQDRPIADEAIVVWYTFGAHHVPRPEDWPVMPATSIGFKLKPSGFFDRNPALDLPRSPKAHTSGLSCH